MTPLSRQAHTAATRLIDTVRTQLRARRWVRETRTGCAVEGEGFVRVAGRSLVLDQDKRVRAFTEAFGTEDSASLWRLYYDERSVLRAAFFSWNRYHGLTTEGVMAFDAGGGFIGCSMLLGDAGGMLCGEQPDASEALDPAVAAVTAPPQPELPETVRWVMIRDPATAFAKCETRYEPLP